MLSGAKNVFMNSQGSGVKDSEGLNMISKSKFFQFVFWSLVNSD